MLELSLYLIFSLGCLTLAVMGLINSRATVLTGKAIAIFCILFFAPIFIREVTDFIHQGTISSKRIFMHAFIFAAAWLISKEMFTLGITWSEANQAIDSILLKKNIQFSKKNTEFVFEDGSTLACTSESLLAVCRFKVSDGFAKDSLSSILTDFPQTLLSLQIKTKRTLYFLLLFIGCSLGYMMILGLTRRIAGEIPW